MAYFRQFGGQMALLLLSFFGAAIASYLTLVHYTHVTLLCSASGVINCEHVLSSSYGLVPETSIPTAAAGILWFLVGAALPLASWLMWPEKRSLRLAELIWAILGMLVVLYLVYVELVLVHAICIWCTVV